MPPSGFLPKNTDGLKEFLSSLTDDLFDEIQKKRVSPRHGVVEEIANIDRDLQLNKRSPAATATLQLVRAYYDQLRETLTSTANEEVFFSAAARVMTKIEQDILQIKVLETA